MTWLSDNWQWLLLAAVAAVQVLNAATERWDAMSGTWPRRLLALLTEMSAAVTSSGHVNPWLSRVPIVGILLGRLKLPLNPYGGQPKKPVPRPVSFPPGPTLMVLALLGSLTVTDGCAATWADNANSSIAAAYEMAAGGWDTARIVLRDRCSVAVQECDTTAELSDCGDYQSCVATRRSYATAFAGVQELLAQASDALAGYVDHSGADSDAQKKAIVQERINRARRGAVELVRKLSAEGLTK